MKSLSLARSTIRPRATHDIWEGRFAPLLLHAPVVVITALVLWVTDDPVITLVLGGLLAMPTYLALAWIEAKRAPLWLSPLSFYFAWYSVGLGPSTLHTARRISDGEILSFSVTYVHPENLAAAYVIYLVASFAFHAGMQAMRPLARRGGSERQGGERAEVSVMGFAILWAVGIAVRVLGSAVSFLGSAAGLLHWAPLAALCAFTLVRGSRRDRGMAFWALLGAGMLIEFVFGLRTGSKTYIMFSFLPVVWFVARDRALRKWLLPAGAVLILFYVTLVSPIIQKSREARWEPGENPSDRIVDIYTQDTYAKSASALEQGEMFLDRMFDPLPVAFLHREVERTGLRYGETMGYLAYAFIPRILWPEKPDVTRGAWFTLYLGQATNERNVTTSTGQTATGELYWNFGLLGAVLGMGLIGVLMGALWRLAGANPYKDAVPFFLYLSLCSGMSDMPEAGTVLVAIVYRTLVIGVLLWVTRYVTPMLRRRPEARVNAG